MRLRLTLQTCNPTWVDTSVVDAGHRIEVSVSAKAIGLLGGNDCQHPVIVALPESLAGRCRLIWRAYRGHHDRERFTTADYEAPLVAMGACLDDLDWPTCDGTGPEMNEATCQRWPSPSACMSIWSPSASR